MVTSCRREDKSNFIPKVLVPQVPPLFALNYTYFYSIKICIVFAKHTVKSEIFDRISFSRIAKTYLRRSNFATKA